MKLYSSPTSPYVRKVRALIIEAGLEAEVDQVLQSPQQKAFHAKNPLARVPAFETDEGLMLYDSPVIAEYLDSRHRRRKLFPARGPARWQALKLQAIGDGILDWAVPLRQERTRPAKQRSPEYIDKATAAIRRGVAALDAEAKAGSLDGAPTIGHLAAACALGYLDFRFPDLQWRKRRRAASAWYESFAKRPSIATTAPP